MKIIVKAYSYDYISTMWRKHGEIVTEKWPRVRALVKEAKDRGLRTKVIVQK